MTNKIKAYSATPASNNASSPDGWPEGMAPSGLNNSDREFAARVREFYEDSSWIDYGDAIVSSTSTTVSITGDVTAQYIVNRAIRAGQSESYVGYVTAAVYGAPNTSITCAGLDLTAVSQIELGGIKRGNQLPNDVVLSLGTSTTAATQTAGDATTKIATTAFVTNAVSVASGLFTVIRPGAVIGGTTIITQAFTSITSAIPDDDTVPLVTEGQALLSVSFATGATSSTVMAYATIPGTAITSTTPWIVALFAGSTCIGATRTTVTANESAVLQCTGTHSPGTTTAATYSVRIGDAAGSGTFNVNGTLASARALGGAMRAVLNIVELKG